MGAPLGTWCTFLYLRDNIESPVRAVLTTDTFQLSLCPTLGTLGGRNPSVRKTQKHQCCCLQ